MAQRRSQRSIKLFGPHISRSALSVAIACLVLLATLIFLFRDELFSSQGISIHRNSDGSEALARVQDVPPQASGTRAQNNTMSTGSDEHHVNATSEAAPSRFLVDVSGAVLHPGVYQLNKSDVRVIDAVEAAGGLTDDADRARINLAQALRDGEKVYVPHVDEQLPPEVSATPATPSLSTAPEKSSTPSLVNINTADAEVLKSLPGVGDATAAAIIEEREIRGAFESIEDIMRVSGIGQKKFEKLKDAICV